MDACICASEAERGRLDAGMIKGQKERALQEAGASPISTSNI